MNGKSLSFCLTLSNCAPGEVLFIAHLYIVMSLCMLAMSQTFLKAEYSSAV
jgi:hypothetical protein